MSAFTLTKNMPWETYAVGARAQVKSKARTPAARGGRTPAVPRGAPGDGGGIVSGVVPPNLIDSSGMGAPGANSGRPVFTADRLVFTAETEEGSAAMTGWCPLLAPPPKVSCCGSPYCLWKDELACDRREPSLLWVSAPPMFGLELGFARRLLPTMLIFSSPAGTCGADETPRRGPLLLGRCMLGARTARPCWGGAPSWRGGELRDGWQRR